MGSLPQLTSRASAEALARAAEQGEVMRHVTLVLCCFMLTGCSLWHRLVGPAHAPPEEAAGVEVPLTLPEGGRQIIPGPIAVAIQLALDDFLPWTAGPHPGATPREICLYQRESYDVTAAPGPNEMIFVRFTVRDGVCDAGGPPVMDMGATYAVDARGKRILAVQR